VTEKAIPLTEAPLGEPLRLVRIDAGHRMTHRLLDLGLTHGVELTVLQDSGGPLLIRVRDSRIALGRGMARHLAVTPCGESGDAAVGRRGYHRGRRHHRHGLRWGRARRFGADSTADAEQDV